MRALVVVALLVSTAAADELALPNTRATLNVPASWTRADVAGLVVGLRGPHGAVAAITRAQVPNPDAWRAKTRDAYVDEIERGVLAAAHGRRVSRKVGELRGIPHVDLEVKREGGAMLHLRVLLYRTYALSLAVETPAGASPNEARTLVTLLLPPPA